ncbi:MAG: Peptidoglycan glycosyltransferase [Myxococcales bacterium]|nr:Peptidoglycan glycosyltransferase [Myxococcales bacterium]
MSGESPRIKPMTPGVPRAARFRAYIMGAVVTTGLTGVGVRAWALQVSAGDHYRALAERQHGMRVEVPAPRGDVLDAHDRPLAVSADADSIWANPREVKDVAATAEKLARLVDGDPRLLEAKLGGDRRFVWIDRHVTTEVARAVREAKLPGIEVAREPRRWYPARSVAGPVIGRADIDGNGVDGVELSMNDLLRGKRAAAVAVRDARGRAMLADGLAAAEPGATVHLSLDRTIQSIADLAIADAVTTNKAKSGVAVVLDVKTSRVLAMASYPSYDPNGGEGHGARNRAVTDAFEAGSVMKVFSIAAALDDGTVSPDTEFDLHGGQYRIGPKTIRDVHHDLYSTVSNIIKRSSNVGAAQIALRFGRDKLYAALRKFGFGTKTGIELPGEQAGTIRDGSHWRDIELATISYGYGLTVTPLQIAAALAAIGNRGMYREPRIVDEVIDSDGTALYRGAGESRRVVSEKAADQMMAMLLTVFDKGKFAGTAHDLVVPGFKCGGKTGTAHKYDPETKQYAPDRYLSSFAGLAPVDHPRLAIVVLVDEPSGGDYFGGKVAGPVFAAVASEALRYLGVPGEALPPDAPGPAPVAVHRVAGAAPLGVHDPIAPVPAPPPEPAIDPSAVVAPDFRGMGVARALDLARSLHLDVEIHGGGRVLDQDPAPGQAVSAARVTLEFSDGATRISAAH